MNTASLRIPYVGNDNLTATGVSFPSRQVILRTPARLRQGESGTLHLGFLPTADEPAASTYSYLAEASLELPGFELSPGDAILQPVALNQALNFTWQAAPYLAGKTAGVASLKLYFYAQDGSQVDEILLSAQPFTINVPSLFGLNVGLVRFLSITCAAISAILWLAIRPARASH